LLGWYEMAAQSYQEAAHADPGFLLAWQRLAESHEKLGCPLQALAVLQQAVQHCPDDPSFWYQLGACFHRRQDYVKVHEILSTLRKLDPLTAEMFYERHIRSFQTWR
jgi:tetratricopeptide (TPR) repeat protein